MSCFTRLFSPKTVQLSKDLNHLRVNVYVVERTRKCSILRASKKLRLGVSKRIPPHRFRSFGSSAHRRGFFVPNNLPSPHGGGYCLHYDQVNPFNTRRPAKTTSKDRVGTDAARHDLCSFMYLQRCAVKKIFLDLGTMPWLEQPDKLGRRMDNKNSIQYFLSRS